MKNKSWKYPFGTFADRMFDGNKDGKLDTLETAFRDAHMEEMNQNAARKNTRTKSGFVVPENPAKTPAYDETETTERKNANNITPLGVQLVFILIAIVVLAGGFIMALSTEGTMFIKAIILFGAVAIAISLLKFVGAYR